MQMILDFTSPSNERYALLRSGLRQIKQAKLIHWSLCLLVMNHETEHRGLVRDYATLADLLWADRATVVRCVQMLEGEEVLRVDATFTADGRRSVNEYRINWQRITALASQRLGRQVGAVCHAVEQSQNATHGSQIATRGSQIATSSIERILPENSRTNNPDRREPPIRADSKKANRRQQRDELVREVPALAEAARRLVAPLPANTLSAGIFVPVTVVHLHKPAVMLEWFRRQLSAAAATDGTEADLLLVLCAAIEADTIPADQVRRSRPAIFASLVSQGNFRKVLRHLRRAEEQLRSLASSGAYVPLSQTPQETHAHNDQTEEEQTPKETAHSDGG